MAIMHFIYCTLALKVSISALTPLQSYVKHEGCFNQPGLPTSVAIQGNTVGYGISQEIHGDL